MEEEFRQLSLAHTSQSASSVPRCEGGTAGLAPTELAKELVGCSIPQEHGAGNVLVSSAFPETSEIL